MRTIGLFAPVEFFFHIEDRHSPKTDLRYGFATSVTRLCKKPCDSGAHKTGAGTQRRPLTASRSGAQKAIQRAAAPGPRPLVYRPMSKMRRTVKVREVTAVVI
ncbi:hypothetical protein GGQ08_001394 [Salinibacter ruber]|nr:hypothetical protein [Salinibacter ruber]MCS3653354.1 hypothetical protein [Salinibacter ruber]